MTVNVNLKSLVIGLLLGVAVILALGAASNYGKYQVALSDNPRGWFVIARVDTDTGEVVAVRKGELEIFETPHVYVPAATC